MKTDQKILTISLRGCLIFEQSVILRHQYYSWVLLSEDRIRKAEATYFFV